MFRQMNMIPHLPFLVAAFLAASSLGSTVDYIDNGRGPVPLHIPSDYDGSEPLPLIVALHGYNDPGVDGYFDFVPQVDQRRFLYCAPEGTVDAFGNFFWNGTDACCNFLGSGVDDSGYLRQLVELIQAQYAVDDRSIHFTGISNGGFMSYRMACDHADLIASIVPLAGTTYGDASDCTPQEPVHVLHIHGTADSTIRYDGGCIVFNCYPGAEESVSMWTDYNGCDFVPTDGGPAFNLDWSVGGNETSSTIYEQACADGVTVELWEMAGSEHVPNFRRGGDPRLDNLYANRVIDWMLAHRKPGGGVSCPADLDRNGTVDIDDLLSVLIAWGSGDATGDVDADGLVGGDDLLLLVGSWGACR